MHRRLKATGLTLVTVLALTAVLVSSASAQFKSSKEHTIISGGQSETHKFTAGAGFAAIACTTVSFSGTMTGTTGHTQVIQPTYGGCEDSLGRTVDVSNSLTYTFRSGATAGETKGNVDLSGSMTLKMTSSGSVACTVTIVTPQTDNGITYKNLGGTKGVEVTTNSTNLKTTIEGGFFGCGTSTTNGTAGTVTGTTVVTGKDTAGVAAEISVS